MLIDIKKIKHNTGQIPGLPKNPRVIRDSRYAQLKQSVIDDPEMLKLRELLVFQHKKIFVVIGGNMRLSVLRDLEYTQVECKVIDPDTPVAKLRAYVIKDNIAYGDNDIAALEDDWDLVELQGWGLDIFDDDLDINSLDDSFELPDGEKSPFQEITFILSDAQAETVQSALKTAKVENKKDGFNDKSDNQNSNGNAIYRIVLEWAEQKTSS